jgi:hypothetical protein
MMTTPRKFLRTLSIIHAALLIGPLILGAFLFLSIEIAPSAIQNSDDIFIYIFPLLGMIGIFAGKFLYKRFLSILGDKKNLREKLVGFQSASIIQYALVEGPAFLNLVWFGVSGNSLFLTVAGVLLIYLFVQRPTITKIVNDLQLKGEEERQFNRLDQTL